MMRWPDLSVVCVALISVCAFKLTCDSVAIVCVGVCVCVCVSERERGERGKVRFCECGLNRGSMSKAVG